MTSSTCEIAQEVVDAFKKFKLNNASSAALCLKIDPKELKVVVDDQSSNDDVPLSEIAESLPPSTPRFIAFSYKHTHSDGRFSFPLVFIFYCPKQINPTLAMLYSSTKTKLVSLLQISKVFDIQDSDELTEEWLKQKLGFFG